MQVKQMAYKHRVPDMRTSMKSAIITDRASMKFVVSVIAVSISVAVGIHILANSHAATASINLETEHGILSQPAAEQSDATASGGKTVSFGTPSVTGHVVPVATAAALQSALTNAQPGDVITLADGIYKGNFVSLASGTASTPITVTGSRKAVIDGGTLTSGYGFHLGTLDSTGTVQYWNLKGFTVTDASKGIVFDRVQHSKIDSVAVQQMGQEGIHLRDFSSDNTISNSTVTKTGQDTQGYGEGIYIGSAVSNWSTNSQSKADHSDRNVITGNTISYTGAENIDIKEGTHDGIIQGNHFDGTGMCWSSSMTCNYADSWIDMKGADWQISGNIGSHVHVSWSDNGTPTNDGYQVHAIAGTGTENSGNNNSFSGNQINDVDGYGINVDSKASGTAVKCDNTVQSAGKGLSNVSCK
jgi:hypothetical protein